MVIVATGSEVSVAVDCANALEAQGIGTDVVSMPCLELFDAQSQDYRTEILPHGVLRVAIEAGTTFGWAAITGTEGLRIGIDTFGASGPGKVLMDYFGFTAEKIVPQIIAKLNV